jgi:hypothetical protein
MPDPRQPQRPQPPQPQHRQPAAQPHTGRPVERPVPSEHQDPSKLPAGIHAGDPAAAAKKGAARPVRPLPPSEQAPPIEAERKLKKGDSYWLVGSEDLGGGPPRKGKVIRLSDEPGKAVGLEMDEPVGGVDSDGQPWGVLHTCDGRGKPGHCLYARVDQVLDAKSLEAYKAHQAEQQHPAESDYEDLDELTVGPQHSQPATPGWESQTITEDDVGTLDLGGKHGTKESKHKDHGKKSGMWPGRETDEG